MKTTITYRVKGKGAFPSDMLRYDDAKPATSADAARVSDSDYRTITLTSELPVRYLEQSALRWRSFGWFSTMDQHYLGD